MHVYIYIYIHIWFKKMHVKNGVSHVMAQFQWYLLFLKNAYMYIYVYIHVSIYICVYTYIIGSVHVYIYIWINASSDSAQQTVLFFLVGCFSSTFYKVAVREVTNSVREVTNSNRLVFFFWNSAVVCLGLHKSMGEGGGGGGGTPHRDKVTSALLVVTTSHILCFQNLDQNRMEVRKNDVSLWRKRDAYFRKRAQYSRRRAPYARENPPILCPSKVHYIFSKEACLLQR